jgi:hypothetical protein
MVQVYRYAAVLLMLLLCGAGVRAQTADAPLYALLVPGSGSDTLAFIDPLSGTETRLVVSGRGYTFTGDAVLFYDTAARRVRIATPDGIVRDHPFAQPTPDARRIDWAWSPDQIAWTVTRAVEGGLQTETRIAPNDGRAAPRLLLVDGAREGIRAFPIAFTPDGRALIMDYQPDTIGDITPLRQYAGMFALDVADGRVVPLPGEPGCFCGGGVGAGWFIRLALGDRGFVARAFFLPPGGAEVLVSGAAERAIASIDAAGYTQGGGVVIASNGRTAGYALVRLGALSGGRDETLLVRIDLDSGAQTTSRVPFAGVLRPVAWLEDALLVTDGEFTLRWAGGETIERITRGVVLGILRYN